MYGRKFSYSNYWSSTFTSNPYDLQSASEIALAESNNSGYVDQSKGIKNAVLTARDYGTSKGVTGRLINRSEVSEMNESASNALLGTWTGADACKDSFLNFWYGYADNTDMVWCAKSNSVYSAYSYYGTDCGVRPVLIVPEA